MPSCTPVVIPVAVVGMGVNVATAVSVEELVELVNEGAPSVENVKRVDVVGSRLGVRFDIVVVSGTVKLIEGDMEDVNVGDMPRLLEVVVTSLIELVVADVMGVSVVVKVAGGGGGGGAEGGVG